MNIYLIAGPPGIGKSTNAKNIILENIPVIDHDLAANQYKKQGFKDYQSLASLSANQNIKKYLFDKKDFALELNLGFQSHYDYLNSIASFDCTNKIHLILFFTDDLKLCLDRALLRHENGGHLVEPEVIKEMYGNTIPLLLENKHLFHSFNLIDVDYKSVNMVTNEIIPLWVKNNDLQNNIASKKIQPIHLQQTKKPKLGKKL